MRHKGALCRTFRVAGYKEHPEEDIIKYTDMERPYREFRDLTKLLEEPEEKPGWLFRNDFQNPIKLTPRETDVTATTKSETHFMSVSQRPLPFPYQPQEGAGGQPLDHCCRESWNVCIPVCLLRQPEGAPPSLRLQSPVSRENSHPGW